jgi:hypothetical protein
MKTWIFVLAILVGLHAEAAVPVSESRPALRTDVKVRSSRDRTRENKYSNVGVRTSVERDITEKAFLSIEVRNVSPKPLKDIKISYQFYELQIDRSTGNRMVLTRGMGPRAEKLIASGKGELSIEQLKPLEKKVVETEPIMASSHSSTDMTKLLADTKTTGRRFGGYVIEYYVGDIFVKRDASSMSLLQAHLKSTRSGSQ